MQHLSKREIITRESGPLDLKFCWSRSPHHTHKITAPRIRPTRFTLRKNSVYERVWNLIKSHDHPGTKRKRIPSEKVTWCELDKDDKEGNISWRTDDWKWETLSGT